MHHKIPKDCITTFTGKFVNIFQPKANMFCIEDIAHSLSQQTRFAGHNKFPWTVAQHSLFVCELCNPQEKLEGLMHDSTEAYLIDVPSPHKRQLTNYKQIEHSLATFIAPIFKFQYPFSETVKYWDEYAFDVEYDYLINGNKNNRFPKHLLSLSQREVKQEFLIAYYRLRFEL